MKKTSAMHVFVMRAFAVLLIAFAAHGAAAQNYPMRAVRYIVPQAPGGSSDTLARVLATRLSAGLGQQVVVDNRPGATGIIGAEIAAKAPADGHTLLQVSTSHATNPAMGVRLPYDTLRDFAAIALISQQPNIWLVHPSLPVRNIRELVAFAKPRPEQIDFASSGTGGSQHLAGELLNVMTGIKLVHIPYKGSPPALTDTLAGRVALMSSTMAPAMPHIKGGKLRALAVTSGQRSPVLKNIPALAETVPGYVMESWYGLYAPAGTPADVIAKLNAAAKKAAQTDEFRKKVEQEGLVISAGTPAELDTYVRAEEVRWRKIVKENNITAN
jgi:tripartite-type tricarboxylate transporter receptor subunit TctC